MRDRIIYILKHNEVILKLYMSVMSAAFKLMGLFLKQDSRLVLFVSFMGKGFNDSPKAIYDYMQSHSEYKKYKCVWAFEKPEKFPELNTVKIDTPAHFADALRAKYWVTNTNIERGLKFKKPSTVYLNTWHGVALKRIGNDCPGRKDYNFDTVIYLVVSGEHDKKVFRSAFGAVDSSFLCCGMPRNEELWLADESRKAACREKLGIPEGKKVILYAPTWRESTDGGRSYSIKPPVDIKLWREKLSGQYVLLFRAHHQTTQVMEVEFDDFIWDESDYPAVNDLMIAADILITDYSAIAFDYSVLCRPIFCFGYDYDTYLAQRGTYFDIDDKYPNKLCRTQEELLDRITNIDYAGECENTRRFKEQFVEYGIGATQRCVESIFS